MDGNVSPQMQMLLYALESSCIFNSAYFTSHVENRLNLLKSYRNEKRAPFEKTFKEGYWKTMEVQITNETLT